MTVLIGGADDNERVTSISNLLFSSLREVVTEFPDEDDLNKKIEMAQLGYFLDLNKLSASQHKFLSECVGLLRTRIAGRSTEAVLEMLAHLKNVSLFIRTYREFTP